MLIKNKLLTLSGLKKSDFMIFKDWGNCGLFSGSQVFIDNIFYALMICKMVNLVSEQGNYWVANNFIWGWLLIPVMALAEIIKRDCREGYQKENFINYNIIAGGIILLWFISIPCWNWFLSSIWQLPNPDKIINIILKLVPFYILYALSVVIDNLFYGTGKTIYTFINSLIVNVVYYGAFFILYKTGAISFTLNTIILMFGFGMAVHLLVSIVEKYIYIKRISRT